MNGFAQSAWHLGSLSLVGRLSPEILAKRSAPRRNGDVIRRMPRTIACMGSVYPQFRQKLATETSSVLISGLETEKAK